MIERYAQKNKSITPKTIATEKKEFNGDLFTWKGKKYGKKYTQLKSPGNLTNIYKQITAGKPVIVSVTKKGEGQHWVVIYGYESVKLDKNKKPTGLKYSNFLIRDPGWGNSRKKLSVYSTLNILTGFIPCLILCCHSENICPFSELVKFHGIINITSQIIRSLIRIYRLGIIYLFITLSNDLRRYLCNLFTTAYCSGYPIHRTLCDSSFSKLGINTE